MISLLKLFGIGVFIGIANVVPGVSGGTIAVICNVYDKLIILSSLNIARIKQSWKDILCLALGIGAGIVLFAKVITLLYGAYPAQTSAFFIGVVVGSIPFLFRKTRAAIPAAEDGSIESGRLYGTLACGILGFALMLGMFFLQRRGIQTAAVVTAFSPMLALKLAVMGFFAAVAMLIPGISGSFVLLILGAYQTVLQAVADFNIPLLIPIALGVGAGLVAGARIIAFLLERFPAPMYAFILGLVAGSILYLYSSTSCQPFTMRVISGTVFLIGYAAVSFFSKRGEATEQKEDITDEQ